MPTFMHQDLYSHDPRALWDTRLCLEEVSKDLRGHMEPVERDHQECERCQTLKTDHMVKVEVTAHDPCDSEPSAKFLDGVLVVRRLVHAFADGDPERRGMHVGDFVLFGQGARVQGQLRGITNAGTHRDPAFDGCQECRDPNVLEGQLHGHVVRAEDESLRGCTVTANYKIRVEDLPKGGDLRGTLEGVLVCPCTDGRKCTDFQGFPDMSHPNPWTINGCTFTVLDHTGTPQPNTEVVTWGATTGLHVWFTTRIDLGMTVSQVSVTLVHYSSPATVTALDAGGAVIDSATMSAGGGVPETLVLSGAGITQLVIEAPQDETLLLELCAE